jgi:predicted outer membrane repeat protein
MKSHMDGIDFQYASSDIGIFSLQEAELSINNFFIEISNASNISMITASQSSITVNNSSFLGVWMLDLIRAHSGSLSLINTVFSQNQKEIDESFTGRLLFCEECEIVNIYNCVISRMSNVRNGGVFYIVSSFSPDALSRRVEVINSTVKDCRSRETAGALYTENQILLIQNSSFENNVATRGGAIFVKLVGRKETELQILSSRFINNEATQSGGSIFYAGPINFRLDNTVFLNNSAKHGAFIASPPAKLLLRVKYRSSSGETTNLDAMYFSQLKLGMKSRDYLSYIFELLLVDKDNQIVSSDSNSTAQVSAYNINNHSGNLYPVQIFGKTLRTCDQGKESTLHVYVFDLHSRCVHI